MVLFAYDDTYPFFEVLYGKLQIPKPFPDLLPLLRDQSVLKIALSELYDTVHRAALKELFEITKAYCEERGQLSLMQAQPWYEFWRIIRNSFSHDMRLNFNSYDKSVLPVFWSGVMLDLSLEGKPLTHGRFSREKLQELLNEACAFVEKHVA